jgi:hypothetical protein
MIKLGGIGKAFKKCEQAYKNEKRPDPLSIDE